MRIELSLTPDVRKKTGVKLSFNDRTFVMRKKMPAFFTMTGENTTKSKIVRKEKTEFFTQTTIRLFLFEYIFRKNVKTLTEVLNLPKYYNIDWIIQEPDSSFDSLAIACLKYHVNYSGVVLTQEDKEKYENLIEQFVVAFRHTDNVDKNLNDSHREEEYLDKGVFDICGDCRNSMRESNEVCKEQHEMIQKARKDFIDILPNLWS